MSKPTTSMSESRAKDPFFYRLLLCGLFLILLIACGTSKPVTVDKPIPFGSDRQQLTVKYLRDRYELPAKDAGITPRMIVLHWTAIPTLDGSYAAFEPELLPSARGDLKGAGALNVSAHYLIDRDGTVYRLMPDTVMARHTIGLNHCAIGVENVGGTPQTPLTRDQLRANIRLIRDLASRYPIEYVIGHHEYRAFEDHPLWLEKDSGYRTLKTDPGDEFMKRVRRDLRDLKLKPVPQN